MIAKPTKRTAVYIDGYNLYYGRLRDTQFKWLDLVKLFGHILKVQDGAQSNLEAVKLFTAYAKASFSSHGQASAIAQQSYHRALETLYPETLQIVLGNHSHDKNGALLPTFIDGVPYDRAVRSRVWKIEEKQTDVNLALALYRDAAKGLYDQVIICTNDSDIEPALIALREDFPELMIGIVVPLSKTGPRPPSASLSQHSHWSRRHILDEELEASQLQDQIPTRKKPIKKPSHW